jgi:hypothetical protein
MEDIRFTIRATSEAVFKARWIEAGILEDTEGYVFRPPYPGVELTANQGWDGIITDTEGNIIPGWHCNARVTGSLVETMTAGLPQYDENGYLLHVLDRTWASYIFGLTEKNAIDPDSGFPYRAETTDGLVQYGDPRDLSSPSNERQ